MEQENIRATVVGWISIICWMMVFTPQIYENYKNKTGESLSLWFLWIWLLGDVFNIVGVVVEGLLLTMLLLAIYYTVADVALIYQIAHYRRHQTDDEHERTPLINDDSDCCCVSGRCVMYCMCGLVAFFAISVYLSNELGFAQYMGWCSAFLYVGSRIPQILKNFENGSVQGLSLAMFLFGIVGNATYCASIFLQSTEPSFLKTNLPWLVGAGGTMVFDGFIGLQFLVYRERRVSVEI
jgi:uncharacterized protein with PQ loop repeat